MIVRCGRCRAELEVSGPGEFTCPACGTRNAVRGSAPGLYDVGGGLTVPGGAVPGGVAPGSFISGGASPAPPAGGAPAAGITWSVCPSCSWRFAHGQTEEIKCPNCRAVLIDGPDGLAPKP